MARTRGGYIVQCRRSSRLRAQSLSKFTNTPDNPVDLESEAQENMNTNSIREKRPLAKVYRHPDNKITKSTARRNIKNLSGNNFVDEVQEEEQNGDNLVDEQDAEQDNEQKSDEDMQENEEDSAQEETEQEDSAQEDDMDQEDSAEEEDNAQEDDEQDDIPNEIEEEKDDEQEEDET
ncbi:uncharacterized protein LOC108226020 [Daucus carota subsp. sativus]|uniref:uncharacterized protein LOC108226020 n=1 Tax=Daucus carota subsp. sativus TaxID=79200 RepID=UPI0007B303C9|nr:PREDICTED: glutamic acid-rich protein-like [Daucus carota subsp. sativus]